MYYTIEHIADILSAERILVNPGNLISFLLTDSRRVSFPVKSLFFALHSHRRSGHDFIPEVYQRGVRNFVTDHPIDTTLYADANFLFVDDSLEALQQLAGYHRKQYSIPVIGITGSNGKTIVKEWLHQLLSPEYNIVRSPRSYNSQIGVPLSIWQIREENTLGIFEAGISLPDEMEKLEKLIRPEIGILTNIGDAHQEGFKDITHKLKEKLKLFAQASIVFCNADDPLILSNLPAERNFRLFTWGRNRDATLQVVSVTKESKNTVIEAIHQGETLSIRIPFTDEASIQNATICWCLLLFFEIRGDVIKERMQKLQPVNMRLQLVQAINDCSVINDSYSFDINSFNIALDFLLQQNKYPDKTVIISDLPFSADAESYEFLAGILQEKGIRRVITIGLVWQQFVHLLKNKIPVTEQFRTTEEFTRLFQSSNFRREAILLKGARIFEFEKIAAILEYKVHQTVLEISLTALLYNLRQYQQRLKPGVKLMAMVKAFGYGSGGAEIANILQFHKTDYLAVAYPDEGIELRNAGISLPILVLNTEEASFESIVQNNLEPELYSFKIFTSFVAFLKRQGLTDYPVHLKFDTGMHRLGFETQEAAELAGLLKDNTAVMVKSVFSHLASGEDPQEDPFTMEQMQQFLVCCQQIQAVLGYPFLRHLSNSAAIFRHPALQFDMVRLGIGLYGIDSAGDHQHALQNVGTLKTTIAQLRKVKKGDAVGYNRSGKVNRDSLIATIRIGYADGFSRIFSNGVGKVWIRGKLVPVIGKVCMDMTMIDVTDLPGVSEEDAVEIFGKNLPVTELARWSQTIPYEILTGIHQRVKRIYIEE